MRGRKSPAISAVMPAYNSESFVAEAIESILGQTFGDFEFVIVDDGSTDRTADIIRDYARRDDRILPLFLEHGGSPSAANAAVGHARGAWIARMDADDVALPHRFQTQLARIRSAELDICGALAETIGLRQGVFWYPEQHEDIRRELLFRNGLAQSAVMMRACILKEHPYNTRAKLEDYEMWTRLASRYRMGNIQEALLRYRFHDQQAHMVYYRETRSDFQKYRFRYFYELYPHTPLHDYLPLARVSDKQPLTGLGELRRAGQWLVDLARSPDPLLRKKMALRWQETCERSIGLEDECEAIFQEYRKQIDVDGENDGC